MKASVSKCTTHNNDVIFIESTKISIIISSHMLSWIISIDLTISTQQKCRNQIKYNSLTRKKKNKMKRKIQKEKIKWFYKRSHHRMRICWLFTFRWTLAVIKLFLFFLFISVFCVNVLPSSYYCLLCENVDGN